MRSSENIAKRNLPIFIGAYSMFICEADEILAFCPSDCVFTPIWMAQW